MGTIHATNGDVKHIARESRCSPESIKPKEKQTKIVGVRGRWRWTRIERDAQEYILSHQCLLQELWVGHHTKKLRISEHC